MNQINKNSAANEGNLFHIVTFRFLPYWPLLVLFIALCFMGAFAYMRMALPKYEATALLLVKDEKKGSDDSRMIEALNVFGTKKIVENEVEVIQSRSLMKEVVKTLGLYAPVLMKGKIRRLSAYTTSPINVKAIDPDKVTEAEEIYFTYDNIGRTVNIGTVKYPLNVWVKTPYGELQFTENANLEVLTTNPLYFSLQQPKKVVNSLLGNLNVTAANKLSSVVNLQFVDEVPQRAEDILNELISAYNRAGINDKNALADNTMQFVEERLKYVKKDIDSIEKQIQQYRSEKGVINLSEQSSVFLKNVGDNDQKAAMIDMQLAVLDQVQKFVNSGQTIGNIAPSTLGISDPVLAQLLSKLSTTELEYERLKNTTGANNPVLISLSNELKQLRPSIVESIRIQRINLKASSNQLNETNRKYAETLQSMPEKERNLLEISRQQTIINNVYNFLLQKKEETALSYASTVPDSRILDVAESSIKPISPKKTIIFPAALIAAFIFTFLVIYLKDFASSKIVFRSELETLTGFPVLGEVSYYKKNQLAKGKNEWITQQLFRIIASLGIFNKNNTVRKISVTSSIAGEGKTFISSHLAIALGEAGKRVVVLDFDFKKSGLSDIFPSENTFGVSEFLTGQREPQDIVQVTANSNVSVIKSGQFQPNYSTLLSTDRIGYLFSYLEQTFDFILIDTAPVDPVTDNLISQFSDTTLYIVRHDFTPKALFQFQNNNNHLQETANAGILFNGVKARGFMKGLGYGYGYDYTFKSSPNKKKNTTKAESPKEINS